MKQRMNEWENLLLHFFTLGPTVLNYESIIRDIFLINASFKLFTFSFRLVPTLPPPPPNPRWVGPPCQPSILNYHLTLTTVSITPISCQPITQNTIIPCPEYHLQFYICSYLFFTNIYIYTYTHLTLPSQLLTLNKTKKHFFFLLHFT
jgi:hypothetical protein